MKELDALAMATKIIVTLNIIVIKDYNYTLELGNRNSQTIANRDNKIGY